MKKFFKNKVFWVIVGVIIVFCCYQAFFNNPKNIFLNYINEEYKKLEDLYDDLYLNDMAIFSNDNIVNSNSSLSFKINVDDSLISEEESKVLSEISKLNISSDTTLDNKNMTFNYNLKVNYDDNQLFNIDTYGKKENIYLKLNDILEPYIAIPFEEYENIFKANNRINDSKEAITIVKNTLLRNISSTDFKKEKSKTFIGSKLLDCTKISYIINEQKANILLKNTLTELLNDNEFISRVVNITNEKEQDVKKSIKDMIDELNTSDYDNNNYTVISLYTNGIKKDVVKTEIVTLIDGETTVIEYSDYKDEKYFKITDEDEVIITMSAIKENLKNKITINFDDYKISINEKEKNQYNYEIKKDNSDEKITGEIKIEKTKNKNEYISKINISMIFSTENQKDGVEISINVLTTTKTIDKLTLPDLTNSKKIDEITDSELEEAKNKITSNENINNFIKNIIKE